MHLVVVEESTINCRVIRNSLANMGYASVATFTEAPPALSHLKQYRTDLLVTGKQLRVGSGFYLAEQVRRIPGYETLPILMVAAHYVYEDLLRGAERGVNSFILRPFSPKTFRRKVTALLHHRAGRRMGDAT